MPKTSFIKTVIVGNLADEFIINTAGKAYSHVCGGSALYAATGAYSQADAIGVVSRVDAAYPSKWLESIESKGFDIRGITRSPSPVEHRRFIAWRDADHFDIESPVAHYASLGLTFPHELLGYHHENIQTDEFPLGNINNQIRKGLPHEFIDITAAHLCPLDFSTQVKIINLLETGTINTLSIAPSSQYMKPEYLDKLQVILKGAAVFIPTEAQLIALCHARAKDLWEMTELITDMGCARVVVLRGQRGCCMYDASTKKRTVLPAYPTRWLDPTGMEDTFAGAFLGEFKNSYDSKLALIHGCVCASLKVEGSGPFYILDSLPGLAEARASKISTLLNEV